MYEPYPSAEQNGQTVEPGQRPPAPSSVQTAVRLMYAGAAISAITFILGLTTLGSLKHTIKTQHPHYTASQVNTAANSFITLIVIIGLIGIGLWLWMAWANKRGRNWARITATALFALYTLDMILGLSVQSTALASLVVSFVLWLIGLGTVIMLWRRESSEFFKRPLY
jgi:hypothetical protein